MVQFNDIALGMRFGRWTVAGMPQKGTLTMVQFNDIALGMRFGRWTVAGMPQKDSKGTPKCLCRCECDGKGNEVNVYNLLRGFSRPCGCLSREVSKKACEQRTTHGHTRGKKTRGLPPEYIAWRSMPDRCRRPNAHNYEIYGGRGIAVCDRWC